MDIPYQTILIGNGGADIVNALIKKDNKKNMRICVGVFSCCIVLIGMIFLSYYGYRIINSN